MSTTVLLASAYPVLYSSSRDTGEPLPFHCPPPHPHLSRCKGKEGSQGRKKIEEGSKEGRKEGRKGLKTIRKKKEVEKKRSPGSKPRKEGNQGKKKGEKEGKK